MKLSYTRKIDHRRYLIQNLLKNYHQSKKKTRRQSEIIITKTGNILKENKTLGIIMNTMMRTVSKNKWMKLTKSLV
jgi:hypothetical protein